MKPIHLFILCTPLLAASLTSCGDTKASTLPTGESGAQFKENQGLILTDKMSESIGLKTAEVEEVSIGAIVSIPLQPTLHGGELGGWITADQASKIKLGMEATLSAKDSASGTVKGKVGRITPSPFPALGDFELTMEAEKPFTVGSAVSATFRFPASDSVAAIPTDALLTTAEGNFVYTRNGPFLVRTPVTVGARNEDHVEITDGLYTGDEIAVAAVSSLWLAELQVLRGGKPCTCGH